MFGKSLYIIFTITFSPTSGTEKNHTQNVCWNVFSTTPNITSYLSKGKCFLPPEPTHSRSCFCVLPLQYHNRKQKNIFYKTIVAEVHGAKRISSSLVHTESDFLEYLDSLPLECPNVICGLHNWPELLKNKSLMGWYTLPFKYLGLVIFWKEVSLCSPSLFLFDQNTVKG